MEKLGLDKRLVSGLQQQHITEPSPIQETAVPLALKEKRDIVARAKTGSGKTLAYVLPIVQSLLEQGAGSVSRECRALVLVPSKELAEQVTQVIRCLVVYCKDITFTNVSQNINDQVISSLLSSHSMIVVGTPAKVLGCVEKGDVVVGNVQFLVIDEADLVLSYGYNDDLTKLNELLPLKKCQTFLMSATLSEDVEEIKQKFCSKPAVLKLEESNDESILQYYVKTTEQDKFLLAYVIFKLKLIKGKTIVFVNDIDRCYRLRLFLEQFGIRSCVLNEELPLKSRLHIVEEFNKGVYNLLICTDEGGEFGERDEDKEESIIEEENEEKKGDGMDMDEENDRKKADPIGSGKQRRRKHDATYNSSRGLDFRNVACVLNFDFPSSSKAYTHRIGRTARAGKSGMALSFVIPKDDVGKHKPSTLSTAKRDERVLARVIRNQEKLDIKVKPYAFDQKQVDSFRYRMEDAFRAVTKVAIREARVKEIRNELLASEKLRRHFEENPNDIVSLRHDKELHPSRVQAHLKRVPEYLLPSSGIMKDVGYVGIRKTSENRIRKARKKKPKKDPLKFKKVDK